MDTQQFLAEFGHIANAPDGISRLRELVLQLAVQGRLVAPPVNDEASNTLLNRIRRVRSQLTADKKLPREKPYPNVSKSERAADVPRRWQWAYFGEVWHLLSGRDLAPHQYNDSKIGVPYITGASNIDDGIIQVSRWTPEPGVISTSGDLLITCKGTIGKTAFNSIGNAHIARQIMAIRDFSGELEPRFLKIWLDGFVGELVKKSKSMIPGFSREDLIFAAYPVFPREEQLSIVAKVDELMALCDQLEQQHQDRRQLQNALRQTTLQALASAQRPSELQMSWERLQATFRDMFSEPADVFDLRKAILDIAVSGRLTSTAESDQSASALKKRIVEAKDAAVSIGTATRKKHVKAEQLQETVLPLYWESIALDDAISTIDAGWSPACLAGERDDESKWGVLKTTSVQTLRFLPNEHKELPASLDPRPQYQVNVGDILITRAGPKNRVGICCVVDVAPPRLMISDKLIRFHIVGDLIDPHFVALCLSAGESGRIVERLKSGMADSQMNISQDKLRSITIPLPPIEEQRRILAKIGALMRIIDTLENQLRIARDTSEKATAATVAALAGIDMEQEEDIAVKAPQTELIAPLRLAKPPDVRDEAPLAMILARHNGEMAARDLWQRYSGEIDAFYAQLKTEVAHGWIAEPEPAGVREKPNAEETRA